MRLRWITLLLVLWFLWLLPSVLYAAKDIHDISIDVDILTALAVVQCESNFRPNVFGDLDKPYPSYGLAQFQHRTFRWLALKAGRPDLKWKDPKDQMWLLIWSIKHKYGYLWTCYRSLK